MIRWLYLCLHIATHLTAAEVCSLQAVTHPARAEDRPLSETALSPAQGDTVTTGLRKVTDDMKTKNRGDRSGAVPAGASSSPNKPAAAVSRGASGAPRGPPRLALEGGRKWVVEHQVPT